MKYIQHIVYVLILILTISCQGLFIQNEEDAKFEIFCETYPDIGTPGTEFFIAINTIKVRNDLVSHLARHTFRWDFDADGIFDTEKSEENVKTHIFDTKGEKKIIIEVETPGLDIYNDTITVHVESLVKLYDNVSGYDLGSPDFALDGSSRIAFDAPTLYQESAIWTYQLPDGPLEQVSQSPAFFPEWSPDGKYILFRRNNNIWVVNIETKEEQIILDNLGVIPFIPNWSHNGKELVYTTNTGVERYRLGSNRITQIPTDIRYNLATYSLDDQQVAVASRNNEQSVIELFDTEEGKSANSHELGFHYRGGKLDWSLNNKWMSIGFANIGSIIHILNLKTGELKYVDIAKLEETWYASWSPDGRMLVFEGKATGENKTIWGIEIPEDF